MNKQRVTQSRQQLLQIYSEALEAVNGRPCVRDWLAEHPIGDQPVRVVAVGKAATAMMQGAVEALGDGLDKGLVITRAGYQDELAGRVTTVVSSHPQFSEASLRAGRCLLEFVRECGPNMTLLVLVSGGASSLVEVLPEGVDLAFLTQVNDWLLSHPLPIHQVNRVRTGLSAIKGGKLAAYVRAERCWQLTLSDVIGNDLAVIGSGLLAGPSSTTVTEEPDLPDWIRLRTDAIRKEPVHPSRKNLVGRVQHVILADNQRLREAIIVAARSRGLAINGNGLMQGEAESFAKQCSRTLSSGQPGLSIWGGETVVRLPARPGEGGRCQQLALAVALQLAGLDDVVLLAAGTDGSDGPGSSRGDVAGAMIDGQTIARGTTQGLDAKAALQRADAGRFLDASGDLIDTGPTGSNVNDVVLGLKLQGDM